MFLHHLDIVKSKTAAVTAVETLVQSVKEDRMTSDMVLKDTLNCKTFNALFTSKLDEIWLVYFAVILKGFLGVESFMAN